MHDKLSVTIFLMKTRLVLQKIIKDYREIKKYAKYYMGTIGPFKVICDFTLHVPVEGEQNFLKKLRLTQ